MYESRRSSISWFEILRKLLILIIFMIIIFGLTYFCSNKNKNQSDNNTVKTSNVVKKSDTTKKEKKNQKSKKEKNEFKTSIKKIENASLGYFTIDKLPTKENETKTVTLKQLIKNGNIKTLKTDSGKKCDKNKSKVTIKKVKDKYIMTTTVVSGKKTKTNKSYVGCFSNCIKGKICRGNSSSKEGICLKNKTTKKTNTKDVESTTESTEKKNNESTSEKENKTTNQNNNNNTNTNTNSNNNQTNNNSNKSTYTPPVQTPKTTYYEYKRCTTSLYCDQGVLKNNECVVTKNKTYIDIHGNSMQSNVSSYFAPKVRTTCDTTWSSSSNLAGWSKTGRTKVE